jgi:hypothetical protein
MWISSNTQFHTGFGAGHRTHFPCQERAFCNALLFNEKIFKAAVAFD